MPSPSMMLTRAGEFRKVYRALKRKPALFQQTPIVFCEGDSWFSTPAAMNLLDWLVYPSAADNARGVPVFGRGGSFFRTEHSGDLAVDIFSTKATRRLVDWFEGFEFDLVLLSAGGNDFVDDFLKALFQGDSAMSVNQAIAKVRQSGRYEEVRQAYLRLIKAFKAARPGVPIVAHTYDYPVKLGEAGGLTLANIGAVALIKNTIGPWIGNHIRHVLPLVPDQQAFARQLIDGFVSSVLEPLRNEHGDVFDYVDLRGTLSRRELWFDEMHPTSAGFHALAKVFAAELKRKLDFHLG
ncbi:SGNH/GDSL hydrolase family protein [Pseudomarimonas arenosa]|uniref:SGNH/GDSL hydrolase family protein n=1 Tax=Pseudomarimonas arenosa TaxID=2774145 RepID=A0AAW3ZQR2_9GAMM|nr:SGNH/GDSL hydrolase family protein [Pseudomarimonas arenosa]MBD8527824.1 SGNH/GDSL hydrolase family protein [Pseudomarimonas arenosa]